MAAPRNEDVKITIMDATECLMESNSIDKISLAAIADAADISKGTLYYHYKNKEEILMDITDRFLDQQWDNFIAWTENAEKDTSLPRLIKYVIERNIDETGPRIHLLYNACIGNSQVQEKLIARYRKFEHVIAEKIAERIPYISADYLAWTALLISDGIIVQKGLDNTEFDSQKYIKETEAYIRSFSNRLN